MSGLRDDMKSSGYSKEDEYFFKKDKELLAKLREKSDARREKFEENQSQDFWMRCPKCGSTLKEETYGGVVQVDRCPRASCGGIYFDGGELEILLKAKPGLIQRIFGK
jgi:hypothetical protein